MSDIAGWTFYLGISAIGWASIVVWTVLGWRWLRRRGVGVPASVFLTVFLGLLIMVGAWLILDLGWAGRGAFRMLRRPFGPEAAGFGN